VAAGHVVVACDPLGVGDSAPYDVYDLTFELLDEANHVTAREILRRFRTGQLAPGIQPIQIENAIGVGHSLGAAVLTVQQATHATFDGVAILGFSSIANSLPLPDGRRLATHAAPRGVDLREAEANDPNVFAAVSDPVGMLTYMFHGADDDTELVTAELGAYFTGDRAPFHAEVVPASRLHVGVPGAAAEELAPSTCPS
jgi:hypothetical protein